MGEKWLKASFRPVKPAQVDPSVPNLARVWNYVTGGRDNFEADRRTAKQMLTASPVTAQAAVAYLAFQRRVVTYLAAEAGIRQFLHIGTGMPTRDSTHEVAQAVDPSCRVVYTDTDPVVLTHARASLRSSAEGTTGFLDVDPRDTEAIVAGAGAILDFARPVGVMLIGMLNFLEDAAEVMDRTVAVLPAGSHVAVMHPARDERMAAAVRRWNLVGEVPAFLRDRDEIASWFAGLELIEPGIVEVHQWRPAPGDPDFPGGMPLLGAVARKP